MSGEAPADPWSRVAAVTVTHNSAAVIAECLGSLARVPRVVVIDNASDDGSAAAAAAARPDAEIVRGAENLGFGRGCNLGLALLDTEFVLLINPDARLEAGALESLVRAADAYPEAAWLGPALRRPDGAIETSHDVALFDAARGRKRAREEAPPAGDICAGFLSGAVALLRREAIERVGGFDPSILLYHEDDDLGLRLVEAGFSLVRVAGAVALHRGGASTPDGWGVRWRKDWHMAWSRLHVERKHRGRLAGLAVALPMLARRGLKALGYAVLLERRKAWRDAARFAGGAAFCLGLPAVPRRSERENRAGV